MTGKSEYKYGLSYNRANKSYGNGDEVHVTVRGDKFADVLKEMLVAKKKALSLLDQNAGGGKSTNGQSANSTP